MSEPIAKFKELMDHSDNRQKVSDLVSANTSVGEDVKKHFFMFDGYKHVHPDNTTTLTLTNKYDGDKVVVSSSKYISIPAYTLDWRRKLNVFYKGDMEFKRIVDGFNL